MKTALKERNRRKIHPTFYDNDVKYQIGTKAAIFTARDLGANSLSLAAASPPCVYCPPSEQLRGRRPRASGFLVSRAPALVGGFSPWGAVHQVYPAVQDVEPTVWNMAAGEDEASARVQQQGQECQVGDSFISFFFVLYLHV